ncbi:hypothetical protein NKI30_27775, partial [Mesorhizobium opportunistum]|uniref:hypothetical protein n=1 Tax=Mesorhizobium opportunistum TaxID=593909 RepID=UPI00333DE3BC
ATESHTIQTLQAIFRRRFFTLDQSTKQMCAHASPQGEKERSRSSIPLDLWLRIFRLIGY